MVSESAILDVLHQQYRKERRQFCRLDMLSGTPKSDMILALHIDISHLKSRLCASQ